MPVLPHYQNSLFSYFGFLGLQRLSLGIFLILISTAAPAQVDGAFEIEGFVKDSNDELLPAGSTVDIYTYIHQAGAPDCVVFHQRIDDVALDAVGSFVATIGSHSASSPVHSNFTGRKVSDLFFSASPLSCFRKDMTAPNGSMPASSELEIAITVDIGGTSVLLNASPLSPVPAALKAKHADSATESESAAKLGGSHGIGSILRVEDGGSPSDSTDTVLSPSDLTNLLSLINGSSSNYVPSGSTFDENSITSLSSGLITGGLGYTPLSPSLTNGSVYIGKSGDIAEVRKLKMSDITANHTGSPPWFNVSGFCPEGQALGYQFSTDQVVCQDLNLNLERVTEGLGYTPVKDISSASGGASLIKDRISNITTLKSIASDSGIQLTDDTTNGKITIGLGTVARTSIGTSSPNFVVINDTNGYLSSEANLSVSRGGTGRGDFTPNGILYGDNTSSIKVTSAGSEGSILRAGPGGTPAWSTVKLPDTTSQNRILFSSANNQISEIASQSSAALVTNGTGSPSWVMASGGNHLLKFDGTNMSFAKVDLTTDTTTTGAVSITAAGTNSVTISSTSPGYVLLNPTGSANVGVGTTTPDSRLVVNGAIRNTSAEGSNVGTIDFSTSNLQFTTLKCQTFNLYNLKDGGAYSFAVKGTVAATCGFNAYSGVATGPLSVRMPPDHTATIAGKMTLYNFIVLGSDVFVSWTPGYD